MLQRGQTPSGRGQTPSGRGQTPAGRGQTPNERGQTPVAGAATARADSGDCPHRPEVTLFHAAGCHLCERARAQLAELREELAFDLREVDVTGDYELEARYRELLPVVEIDGERAFVYYVQPDGFRRRLARAQSRADTGGS